MKRSYYLILALTLLWCSGYTHAQSAAGIIDPSRSVNWTTAGIAGGVPTRTTICATLNPGATASQINSAIASCPSGQVVFLNAGTYSNLSGIDFGGHSNVTLRGAGASQTFLVFSNDAGCAGLQSDICIASSSNPQMPSPNNSTTWTAGYAKGATSITLGSVSGISAGTLLILDQLDDSSDTGNVFVCASSSCTDEGGNAYGRTGRAQQQIVRVTAVSGNTVTISPGLFMPNWRSSQNPGASFASITPVTGDGVENLSMDHTNGGGTAGIAFLYAYDCWVAGVRSLNANRNHIWLYQSMGSVVRDSYFYGTQNSASQSYGVETFSSSSHLVENNIFQHVTGPITINGSDSGSVYSYNYAIDDYYAVSANWMIPSVIEHEAGIGMDLFEGNSGLGIEADNIHGTHQFLTGFRNHFYGDVYNSPAKSNNTVIAHFWAYSRYFNMVGNVLGRAGFYDTYESDTTNVTPTSVFGLGDSGGGSVPNDPTVASTLMRWGNYDNVTNTVRWNNSEVPSTLSAYSNAVPSSQGLPASFYLSGRPAWWGTMPWPAIGPDVTGGTETAGHAYAIPAETCYNTTSKTNNILNFNASTCYSVSVSAPAPPTNVKAVAQ